MIGTCVDAQLDGHAPGNLAERVQNNEDAVVAIDEARRQLINSVTRLQEQVSELQRATGVSTP